jgi:hypothetical protein
MGKGAALLVLVAVGGCADDDACAELQAVCASCPPGAEVARASCNKTAREGSERDCRDRLEDNTYREPGCSAE